MFICGGGTSGASEKVDEQFTRLNNYTTELMGATQDALNTITAIRVPNVHFTVPVPDLDEYTLLPFSALPDDLQDVDPVDAGDKLPDDPGDTDTDPDRYTPGVAPTAPADAPSPTFGPAPDVYTPSFDPDPELNQPTLPTYEDISSGVPVPTLREVHIPVAPTVDLSGISFDATPPVFNVQQPDAAEFAYEEPEYHARLATEVEASIRAMLDGSSGLPQAVEAAIWARATEREYATARRAIEEARSEWARLGHALPGGAVDAKIADIRQNAQNQANTLSRDQAIRTQEVLLDQLKFAVAQGIAYEEQWIGLFNAQQARKLQAARFAVDIAINVFNALVRQFEAEAAVYKTESEVYVQRIQAKLAKLQVYSEQIRAAQLIGQLNEQDYRIYAERLHAIEVNVRLYLAELEGYKSELEGNTQILQQARQKIDKQLAQLDASDKEIKAWLGTLQGEDIKQQAAGRRAQTYLARVQAFDTVERNRIARLEASIRNDESISRRYEAQVGGFRAWTDYLRSRAQQIIAANEAKVQKYAAETSGKNAYNLAYIQKMNSHSQAMQQNTELAIKNGEINSQNALAAIQQVEQQAATVVQVLSQLLSSAMSAVHVGASIGDSNSHSYSCSYSTTQRAD